ncbi:unnamed protein product [Lactuca saligna]|uniref:Uncharacterized protein n=1 Tax=Lactuca saligna TaxID=75948 RepID=A0AA36A314_LACSI|nr:unnamed protein product [Lactuca saligna]
MTNQSEEFMKKLEAFMTQQTQSTSELKAAVEALQAKQATLEEGLSAWSHNKSNKQGGSEASVEEEIEMESFDDPPEQSQGRGRGTGFGPDSAREAKGPTITTVVGRGKGPVGGQPNGSGQVIGKGNDSWRTGKPQPFKHSWD